VAAEQPDRINPTDIKIWAELGIWCEIKGCIILCRIKMAIRNNAWYRYKGIHCDGTDMFYVMMTELRCIISEAFMRESDKELGQEKHGKRLWTRM